MASFRYAVADTRTGLGPSVELVEAKINRNALISSPTCTLYGRLVRPEYLSATLAGNHAGAIDAYHRER